MTTLSDHQHTDHREATTVPPVPASPASPRGQAGIDAGLLLLRLALGVVFIAHGLQKFLVDSIPGVASGFGGMGIPAPEIAAVVVAGLEVVGGLLLIVGLGTRIVGALLAVTMAVAMVLVHLPAGFYAADGGFEYVMLLALASLALTLAGPGRFAIDALIRRRRSR
ncbi:DoxX family protein [Plantibacter cousiniae (nom. nud.)]|uniref:DoxX family protein n=1 Tax=Plantibacter cousiniae (nom. nud.) TaxID=199709 RepID=UPI001DE2F9DE|nr:DoxX family protein [Plantibacter cousiniae]CAH0187159.1 Putative oxidoreductase CatD [Plantibacter cousiniae]